MLKKPSLPLDSQNIEDYYENWCHNSISEAHKVFSRDDPDVDDHYHAAIDFSRVIMPPKEYRKTIWTAIRNSNQLDAVDKTRRIFQEYKNTLTPGLEKNLMNWLSFPPFTPDPPSQAVTHLPISLSEQNLCLVNNEHENRFDASWNGLQTCTCPRKSPQGVDSFMQTIADDLRDFQQALIIDFGSGDCLPLIPLISRLTYLNVIHLHLIDPSYDSSLIGDYHIFNNSITGTQKISKPIGEENCSVHQFFRICAELLRKGQHLHVTVNDSARTAVKKLSESTETEQLQHVLYTVDPIPYMSFYKDFTALRNFLIDKKTDPFFYCLNESNAPEYIAKRVPIEVILKPRYLFK